MGLSITISTILSIGSILLRNSLDEGFPAGEEEFETHAPVSDTRIARHAM